MTWLATVTACLVSRAVDVPARRRLRSGAADRQARQPARARRARSFRFRSAARRSGGSGSSRSATGSGHWPRSAGRPAWSRTSRRSAAAGSWGSGGRRGRRLTRGPSEWQCGTNTVSSSQATGATRAVSRAGPSRHRGRGTRVPMSFISRSRLIIDSTRSPSVAATTAAPPRIEALPDVTVQQQRQRIAPAARQARMDPAKPSQVFFGLMAGAIGCRPMRMPAK